jgi:hypothetical protein
MRRSFRPVRAGTNVAALCALLFAAAAAPAPHARAWWSGGHRAMTLAAVKMLPPSLPGFFRDAGDELAEMALEPDVWKSQLTPRLRAAEQPEHYVDLEYFEGQPLPRSRYDALRYYIVEKHIDPSRGGTLPYALEEGCERLQLAFQAVRREPKSEEAWHRAVCYAGWLAHYCQDACMPLHTTVNYDGKPGPGGGQVQRGIHARLDGYPEKNGFTPDLLAENQSAEQVADVWTRINAALRGSFEKVGECYALDAAGGFSTRPEQARDFVLQRARLSAKLTADLWLTAWEKSDPSRATIK